MAFVFLNPGSLIEELIELRLWQTAPGDPAGMWVPAYHFNVIDRRTGEAAGAVDLRIGNTPRIRLYAGHIGYRVEPRFRGRHYAARAVRLLLPLAVRHGMDTIWITCNPENWPSRRTCELAGGEFMEIVDVPEDDPLWAEGETRKCRYRFRLDY